MIKLSLIIPVKDEAENIGLLLNEIEAVLHPWIGEAYEVLIIDDGSRDSTWAAITELKQKNAKIRAWRFQYNCGKATALNLAFKEARGEFVGTLDGDLQDDPAEFPEMMALLDSGFDLVSGWKKKRHDPLGKTLPSKLFNSVVSMVAGVRLHDFNCGLKLYRAGVVRHMELYGDFHRFIPVKAAWMGFRITEKVVQHRPRIHGVSKYGWTRLISGFLDLLSLIFLQLFSKKPLHLFGTLGFFLFSAGTCVMAWFALTWMQTGHLHIRPLMILGMTAIITGLQFIFMGLLGEMILNRTSQNETAPIAEQL